MKYKKIQGKSNIYLKLQNNKKVQKLKEKGITLISLVVTILILLILVGVTISQISGENGLIKRTKEAVEKYKNASEEEQIQLGELEQYVSDFSSEVKSEKESLLDMFFPVGSIYISTNSSNPSTYLGGEWTSYAEGRTLVGVGTSDINFDAGSTGGESTHTLSVEEMPAHSHRTEQILTTDAHAGIAQTAVAQGVPNTTAWTNTTRSAGGGEAHNNLQPYIVVYIWRRIN